MRFMVFPIFSLVSLSWGAGIDDQIASVNRQVDSLMVIANRLGSQKAAVRIDSLFQADSTLAAEKVRVVTGDKDSMWVKIALDKLTDLDRKIVKANLGEGVVIDGISMSYQAIGADTLYMRRDRAEKALGVISAALKE